MHIESILRKTLKPALGCTEPVAISLGVAAAVMATEGWSPQNPHIPMKALAAENVESVRVAMNKGVFKNAFSIYIPNAGGYSPFKSSHGFHGFHKFICIWHARIGAHQMMLSSLPVFWWLQETPAFGSAFIKSVESVKSVAAFCF